MEAALASRFAAGEDHAVEEPLAAPQEGFDIRPGHDAGGAAVDEVRVVAVDAVTGAALEEDGGDHVAWPVHGGEANEPGDGEAVGGGELAVGEVHTGMGGGGCHWAPPSWCWARCLA